MYSFAQVEKETTNFKKIVRFKKYLNLIIGKTIPQKLFRLYLVTIFLGAILLYLPISLKHGYQIPVFKNWDENGNPEITSYKNYSFIDALFVACSALSTTGLTPCDLHETFTAFGQVVVIILIQVGGIGLITILFLIWDMFRPKKNKKISQIVLLQSERGNAKIGSTFRSIKISVIFIMVTEVVFAIFYSFWLCFYNIHTQTYHPSLTEGSFALTSDGTGHLSAYHNFPEAMWEAIFTSISAINNAGFTIFKGTPSMACFRNDWNTMFLFFIILEIIIGGIGFPVIFDFIEKVKHKRLNEKYKLTLFSKVSIIGFIVVTILGIILAYSFEYGYGNHIGGKYADIAHYQCTDYKEFGNNEQYNKAFTIFFNTMVTRSAGFETASQLTFSPGAQTVFILLMFIGGAPSSTAGGIRTTTLMVIFASIIGKIAGKNSVIMIHRKIPNRQVRDSFVVFVVASILVLFVGLIIFYTMQGFSSDESTQKYSLLCSIYEAASAFGTVGLSMGITQNINAWGLIIISLLMFVGQLGISSTLLSWTKKNPKGNLIELPEEEIRIG